VQTVGEPVQLPPADTNDIGAVGENAACCSTTGTQVGLLQNPPLLLAAGKTVSPVPVLKSSSPAITTNGAGNFRLAVRGSGSSPGSVVTWNGKAHSASNVCPTEITANIAVKNPTPGGGKSNILAFPIKAGSVIYGWGAFVANGSVREQREIAGARGLWRGCVQMLQAPAPNTDSGGRCSRPPAVPQTAPSGTGIARTLGNGGRIPYLPYARAIWPTSFAQGMSMAS